MSPNQNLIDELIKANQETFKFYLSRNEGNNLSLYLKAFFEKLLQEIKGKATVKIIVEEIERFLKHNEEPNMIYEVQEIEIETKIFSDEEVMIISSFNFSLAQEDLAKNEKCDLCLTLYDDSGFDICYIILPRQCLTMIVDFLKGEA